MQGKGNMPTSAHELITATVQRYASELKSFVSCKYVCSVFKKIICVQKSYYRNICVFLDTDYFQGYIFYSRNEDRLKKETNFEMVFCRERADFNDLKNREVFINFILVGVNMLLTSELQHMQLNFISEDTVVEI